MGNPPFIGGRRIRETLGDNYRELLYQLYPGSNGKTDEPVTREEVRLPLPGDELVPQPKQMSTRSITLQASTAEIWPWLVQLGQGRGGLVQLRLVGKSDWL